MTAKAIDPCLTCGHWRIQHNEEEDVARVDAPEKHPCGIEWCSCQEFREPEPEPYQPKIGLD